ncbi:GRB10-interacting GYF protein 2-like isoform X2 [Pieris rapae]|uniref:GRB10-interacting GYF protein 2-like isoform X2 n=1 Tax=Pieris rapae TaxID=64459 RepID=UPI001E27C13B|nr:GRB10-interacting GYF protein 2-like isoform X2 [Pieris rapae]
MFKFRCFRASFDFITGKQQGWDCDLSPVSVTGVYRKNEDEELMCNPPRKLLPSMVKLPISQTRPIKTSKSTGDLTQETIPTHNLTQSSHDLSLNTRLSKDQLREQKKLEKQQILEQKKQEKIAFQQSQRQEKIAAQERKRQEKLAIQERQKQEKLAAQDRKIQAKLETQERQRQEARQAKTQTNPAREQDKPKKKTAPIAPQSTINQQISNEAHSQLPQNPEKQTTKDEVTEPKPQRPAQTTRNNQSNYPTNTLESSISRSSGPPPYGEFPEIITDVPDSNITFSKPVADSSWDLISQHREQVSKNSTDPIVPKRKKDVQYNVGNLRLGDNSDA